VIWISLGVSFIYRSRLKGHQWSPTPLGYYVYLFFVLRTHAFLVRVCRHERNLYRRVQHERTRDCVFGIVFRIIRRILSIIHDSNGRDASSPFWILQRNRSRYYIILSLSLCRIDFVSEPNVRSEIVDLFRYTLRAWVVCLRV